MPKTAAIIDIAPPALEGVLREGRVAIGPDLSYRILNEANYPRQRRLAPGHVALLAETMRRGNWMPGGQIAFGVLGNRLFLVNGQHRLTAVFDAERECVFQVLLLPVTTEEELHQLYYRFDTEQRGRSLAEVLTAVGFADSHGLSARMARCVYDASLLITTGFQHAASFKDPITTRSRDTRLEAAREWAPEAVRYERLLEPASVFFKNRLLNSQIAAVALYTLRYQPERAEEFWGGVGANDGLRKGDARHTLLRDLQGRDLRISKALVGCQIASQAWNAFREGRETSFLRAYDVAAFKIAGTPFNGKDR